MRAFGNEKKRGCYKNTPDSFVVAKIKKLLDCITLTTVLRTVSAGILNPGPCLISGLILGLGLGLLLVL
jgi:hypothetical protein